MPPNTFKLHSKLGLWVWKSFFANLLYMNACRSHWMVNAVGGAVSMVTFQRTFFLALQLDLHCWAVVNEKVTAQSHLEGWRRYEICSLSRCSYILSPWSCSMLVLFHLFMVPQHRNATHMQRTSFFNIASLPVNMNNIKAQWKKWAQGIDRQLTEKEN